MDNYRGIYYAQQSDQLYYEGGAHFKYDELFLKLEHITQRYAKFRGEANLNSNDCGKQGKAHSRNVNEVVKSLSQVQLDYLSNYPHYKKNNEIIEGNKEYNCHYPRTRSEEASTVKQIQIPFNLNSNKEGAYTISKATHNYSKYNQTRNIHSSSQARNGTMQEQASRRTKSLIPFNSTMLYSTSSMMKNADKEHRPACSLVKIPNNGLTLNYCYDVNDQTAGDKKNYSLLKAKSDNDSLHMRQFTAKENSTLQLNPKTISLLNLKMPNFQLSRNKHNDAVLVNTIKQSTNDIYQTNSGKSTSRNNNALIANSKKNLIIGKTSNGYNYNYAKSIAYSNAKTTSINSVNLNKANAQKSIGSYKEYKLYKANTHSTLPSTQDKDYYHYDKGQKNSIRISNNLFLLKENAQASINAPLKKSPLQILQYNIPRKTWAYDIN